MAKSYVRKELHTKSNETKLKRHLERIVRRDERESDRLFMKELGDIYAGKSRVFDNLREGGSFRRSWRGPYHGVVLPRVPNREADLVVTKKHGKPVVTILEIPVLDEQTAIEAKQNEIESGNDSRFNEMLDGEEYEDIWEGPGEDIWTSHMMRIKKVNGKALITVAEHLRDYGTKWG